MARFAFVLLGLLIAGCSQSAATTPQDRPGVQPTPVSLQEPSSAEPPAAPAPGDAAPAAREKGGVPKAPSLWTRKKGEDWPTFLGPTGDSHSSEKGIITRWPAEGLRIVWQRPLGEGYGIGSVSRGRFFQADRVEDRARLVCLNAETGAELWKHEYPTAYVDTYGYDGGPRCSPVVDGDYVYMYGVEGWLRCLSAKTGDVVWKVDTAKEFGVVQNFFGVGSTPVIEGDLLIVMVGGSPADEQDLPIDRLAGNGSGIVAFNKFTGKVVYKLSDELASYASLKLATIDGRRWCFAFCRGGLLGFEPRSGKLDFFYPWRARILESVNASMPVVVGNQVLISETYGPGSSLLEVSPGAQKVIWADSERRREKSLQTHWNTPVYVDGYVYASSGRHAEDADLRCVEWKTGKVVWRQPDTTRSSLLYVDGHLISLGEYGQLQLLRASPEKFDLLAEVVMSEASIDPNLPGLARTPLLRYPAWAAPILSHGLLYVRGKDRLVCLELIPDA
jgi:outer membrane protein assembly factor BamB